MVTSVGHVWLYRLVECGYIGWSRVVIFAKYVGLPVSACVCLSHDVVHSFQAIFLKFILCVGDPPRTTKLNFGEDPNPNPRIFFSDSSPLRDQNKNENYIEHNISKGSGWIHIKLGGQVWSAMRKN